MVRQLERLRLEKMMLKRKKDSLSTLRRRSVKQSIAQLKERGQALEQELAQLPGDDSRFGFNMLEKRKEPLTRQYSGERDESRGTTGRERERKSGRAERDTGICQAKRRQ